MQRHFTLRAAVPLAALVALAACSSGPSHNEEDVQFAQQMIPHHQQAVEMSEMAEDAAGPDVRRLAARVKAAQGPEIAQMRRWLNSWEESAPLEHGMHHGAPGMMTDRQMYGLASAKGKAYDRMWLRMMIEHHRGAITMARTEIADGENPDAVALARAIVKAQTDEIHEMQGMLK